MVIATWQNSCKAQLSKFVLLISATVIACSFWRYLIVKVPENVWKQFVSHENAASNF
jgi:hypothetical protein